MKIGVIRFPGSNCDRDVYHAIELAGGEGEYVWWCVCISELSFCAGDTAPVCLALNNLVRGFFYLEAER